MLELPEPVQYLLELFDGDEYTAMIESWNELDSISQTDIVAFLEHPIVQDKIYETRQRQLLEAYSDVEY